MLPHNECQFFRFYISFQKFSSAEDAAKINILGTVLGLYLAKQFVDAHHGKIWVESEGEGKGATFFVELATV